MRWSRFCFWASSRLLGGRMFFGHAKAPNWPAPPGMAWQPGPGRSKLVDYRRYLQPGYQVFVPGQGWWPPVEEMNKEDEHEDQKSV